MDYLPIFQVYRQRNASLSIILSFVLAKINRTSQIGLAFIGTTLSSHLAIYQTNGPSGFTGAMGVSPVAPPHRPDVQILHRLQSAQQPSPRPFPLAPHPPEVLNPPPEPKRSHHLRQDPFNPPPNRLHAHEAKSTTTGEENARGQTPRRGDRPLNHHRIGNPVADVRRRLDAHEVGIHHPPSAHAGDGLAQKGRLAHSALALDDDVLPASDVAGELARKFGARAEMLSADDTPVPKRRVRTGRTSKSDFALMAERSPAGPASYAGRRGPDARD